MFDKVTNEDEANVNRIEPEEEENEVVIPKTIKKEE